MSGSIFDCQLFKAGNLGQTVHLKINLKHRSFEKREFIAYFVHVEG
jgi:hypothetical protein